MRASRNNNWKLCPTCKLIVYADTLVKHKCPEKVKAKIDADIDMASFEILKTWDKDLRKFWDSSDVKFMEWELDNE